MPIPQKGFIGIYRNRFVIVLHTPIFGKMAYTFIRKFFKSLVEAEAYMVKREIARSEEKICRWKKIDSTFIEKA